MLAGIFMFIALFDIDHHLFLYDVMLSYFCYIVERRDYTLY